MVGFTAPDQYEPHPEWRRSLADWVLIGPEGDETWKRQITDYWRGRTMEDVPLKNAWAGLGMSSADALKALVPDSPLDAGLIPPELFTRVLARSRGEPDPSAVDPQPEKPETGLTSGNVYRTNKGWKVKLDRWVEDLPGNPGGNIGGWRADIRDFWSMKIKDGVPLKQAWTRKRMTRTNADTALERNSLDRGMIPPELITRVIARSRNEPDPDDKVVTVIIYPPPTT